jgi:hypothetical protein
MDTLTKELLGTIEAMDWHDQRYLDFMPRHFVRCKLPTDQLQTVLKWAAENTHGRFAIAQSVEEPTDSNHFWVQKQQEIGFESPAEATLFTLYFS